MTGSTPVAVKFRALLIAQILALPKRLHVDLPVGIAKRKESNWP